MPFNPFAWATNQLAVTFARLDLLDAGIVEAQRAPYVTAFPTTGPGGGALVDGQECYYLPDPTNAIGNGGAAWHMKYRASTGKWLCIGGSGVLQAAAIAANQDILNTGYGALASVPTFTAPKPGTYRVMHGHGSFVSAAGASVYIGPSVNGVAPDDQTQAAVASVAVANTDQFDVMRECVVTVATAGHVITPRGKVTSGTGHIRRVWMSVRALEIG
jgi:hypothetical protein